MEVAHINIALELYSIVVTLLIIVHLLLSEGRRERLGRLFVLMLVFNVAVLSCDLVTWLLDGNTAPAIRPILLCANFGVYSFGYLIVAVFTDYLVTYIGTKTAVSHRLVRVVFVLCGIAVLLVAVNQFNHMYYNFDAQNSYQRGDWYWFSQAFPIGMLVADCIVVLRHRASLNWRETISLLSYQVLPIAAMAVQIFIFGITLLYVATSMSMLIIYVSIQVEHDLRLKAQELELRDSRVSIMLSQIQPHFLYNALTAIRHLCRTDPTLAQEAVSEFAGYLRANMDSLSHKHPIPFSEELEHVRNYLSLEEKRFGERLRVVYQIGPTGFLIPSLTLQPLVENAVRHGATRSGHGGTVTIRTEDGGDFWLVGVSDDGPGFDPTRPPPADGRSHVGIENVRHRLASMSRGTLTIQSAPGTGAVAVIALPKAPCN